MAKAPIESVWIGVVQKINVHRIGGRAESLCDKLRTQRRTANPDQKNVLEFLSVRGRDLSGMNIGRERLDLFVRLFDVAAKIGIRSQRRIAQPIVADHAVFIRIRDCACLQFTHGPKRLLDTWLHLVEEIVAKFHPADVDRKIDIVVTQEILLEALPERG